MGKSAKTATKKAKEEKWKQEREKLVEIMGKLDNPDIVGYFYKFVAGKLYRKPECPASLTCEIEKICKEIESEQPGTLEPRSLPEQLTYKGYTDFCNKLRLETALLLEKIYRSDMLNYIEIVVEDMVKELYNGEQKKK